MTWVRYDDNVANHPKVAPLDDATYRLWREALEWCAHNLTDGVVRVWQLTVTSTRASRPRAAKLVTAGLWHTAGSVCGSDLCPPSGEDGWFIHDYWDYQPSAAKVRAEIAAKAERQRRWLDRRKDAANNTSQDVARDASLDGAPAPPRPAPKGRVGTDVPTAPPAAVGDGTATAGGEKIQPTRPCRTCGNALDSAYHRNSCAKSAA